MPPTVQDRSYTIPSSLALVGVSGPVQRLRQHLERIAPYYRLALLHGEPGTGKEGTARFLHKLSPAADGPFIVCTADAIAQDGAPVLAARRGTLFIDDLGSLSLTLQDELVQRLAALDRRIRARAIDTRLVAASHVDLRALSATGHFRQDLYGRVAVVELHIAPLRDRMEDLEDLAQAILSPPVIASSITPPVLTQQALAQLRQHSWPGNLRELSEVLERARTTSLDDRIHCHDLPELVSQPSTLDPQAEPPAIERLDEVVHRHVVEVLSRCAGNKYRAAELLGISRSTLYRMLDV